MIRLLMEYSSAGVFIQEAVLLFLCFIQKGTVIRKSIKAIAMAYLNKQ